MKFVCRFIRVNGYSNYFFQVPCKVTSAQPLSEDHLESLRGALGKFLKENEKLLLDTAVCGNFISFFLFHLI